MRIAVEGCCHGELDKIYESVIELERQNGFKIDLLIICGDFQAIRNFDDLQAMAVPPKYQQLNTFYKYYNQEKVAPILTVFIGGNHEASNYMQELPYGGWVAPNIYYMGYANIIQIGGVRIGGISGIFKGHDFNKGHFERPPYTEETKRSVYHVRNLEVFRFKQIYRPVDIFISHDWPKGIYHYGNIESLIKRKPFFKKEIEENKLGSGPLSDLLSHLQPAHWFAAHLHVKFAAHVQHQPNPESGLAKCTKFLALDKCLPRRNFLQVLEIPHDDREGLKIKLDPEWLTVLQKTNHLLNLTSSKMYMPGPGCGQKFDFRVTDKEIEKLIETFGSDMSLPENFAQTSAPIKGSPDGASRQRKQPLTVQINPQTELLCTMLDITDPNAKFIGRTSQELLNESSLGLDVEDDSGDDVANDSEDDAEMPSVIESSFDVSTSCSNHSRWDSSYETTNESFDISNQSSQKVPLSTSTPAKESLVTISVNVDIDDNDDELLSIISAQKSKMCEKSASTPSLSHSLFGSSEFAHNGDSKNNMSHSNFSEPRNCGEKFIGIDINKVASDDKDIICELQLSSSNSSGDKSVSSDDNQHPSLKPQRSSFGMSGLCLDSSGTSPPVSKKRESCEHSEMGNVLIPATDDGSSAKKLKRRNVSLYSEPLY